MRGIQTNARFWLHALAANIQMYFRDPQNS